MDTTPKEAALPSELEADLEPQKTELYDLLTQATLKFDQKKVAELLENQDRRMVRVKPALIYDLVNAFMDLDMAEQISSKSKFESIVCALVPFGLNVNALDERHLVDKETVLHIAACADDIYSDIIKPLLLYGAQANTKNSKGQTPLHVAIIKGYDTRAKALLEGGAEPECQDMKGETALHLAAKRKNGLRMVELLTNFGMKTNTKNEGGCTALHVAIKAGNVSVIRELLHSGAKSSYINSSGWNCLHMAAAYDLTGQILKLLLDRKEVDVNSMDKCCLQTALHKAVIAGITENVRLLLSCNANPNQQDWGGNTALQCAIACQDVTIWKLLLEARADVNIQNKDGYNVSQRVAKQGNRIGLALIKQYNCMD